MYPNADQFLTAALVNSMLKSLHESLQSQTPIVQTYELPT